MNRNFKLLIAGQSVANIGDVLYMVSLINIIFTQTGSATAASFVPFTITSSMFLSSLLTPLLFGKVSLKWLMTGSQIGKSVLLMVLGMGLFLLSGAKSYTWIFLVIGLIAFLDGCANPVRQALIPHYVRPEQLLRANGIGETASQLVLTIIWFIGSLLLFLMSAEELIWIVAGLFILASFLLCMLDDVVSSPMKQNSKQDQLKKGWRLLTSTPILRQIAKIDILETIAGTVWIAAIILVFVAEALNRDESWWGFINGAFCFGLIIGSIYCVKYASYIERKLGSVIFWSSIAAFLVTLLFSLNHIPSFAMLLSLFIGILSQLKGIPQQTVIQSSVPREDLSSVYTSLGAISTGIFGLASLAMGVAADLFGVRAVFVISAALLGWASLLVFKHKRLFIGNAE
ncbi:MFS transporter [Pradoshia sp.]